LVLTRGDDGVPTDCVVNFDNVHTLPRSTFRRRVAQLSPHRMMHARRDAPRRPRLLTGEPPSESQLSRLLSRGAVLLLDLVPPAGGHKQSVAEDRLGHNSV
jgi:hypothetical protein